VLELGLMPALARAEDSVWLTSFPPPPGALYESSVEGTGSGLPEGILLNLGGKH
jgi:hypothetical protein